MLKFDLTTFSNTFHAILNVIQTNLNSKKKKNVLCYHKTALSAHSAIQII